MKINKIDYFVPSIDSYDAQGQLTEEWVYGDSGTVAYKYAYEYDNGGNLLRVAVVGVMDYATYSYDNPQWPDLLTAYNGQAIAYEGQTLTGNTVTGDAVSGNPINWYNFNRSYSGLT